MRQVNTVIVQTYWNIGEYLVQYEQKWHTTGAELSWSHYRILMRISEETKRVIKKEKDFIESHLEGKKHA